MISYTSKNCNIAKTKWLWNIFMLVILAIMLICVIPVQANDQVLASKYPDMTFSEGARVYDIMTPCLNDSCIRYDQSGDGNMAYVCTSSPEVTMRLTDTGWIQFTNYTRLVTNCTLTNVPSPKIVPKPKPITTGTITIKHVSVFSSLGALNLYTNKYTNREPLTAIGLTVNPDQFLKVEYTPPYDRNTTLTRVFTYEEIHVGEFGKFLNQTAEDFFMPSE